MSFSNWIIKPEVVLTQSVIIPVMVIHDLDQTVFLAEALLKGGVSIFEVTLRTPIALDAVKILNNSFPSALVGVGTVITPSQLDRAVETGAQFAVSPGLTRELLLAGSQSSIPLIPGVSSVSDVMEGIALGYTHFKFFPAALAGGVGMLRAFHGLFPHVRFCPTGGINAANCSEYLVLPNVLCVGGSWIVPDDAIRKNEWSLITELCLSMQEQIAL